MILRAITLSGWRCYLNEITVGEFNDRLNVVCGPNGIGKSTLFEALRRALMDSHAVTGQDIQAIRPWGRSLPPRVSVSFLHEGVHYRVTKQFLDDAFALLERKENGIFRRLAEGRHADEQVRRILSKNPPGRGLSQPRNWGLAQVLWAPQGELKFSDLSGDVITDIRNLLGVQVTDIAAGPIEKKILYLYERYFTQQGKVKTGKAAPPLAQMQASLDNVRQRRAEALEMLQRYEATSRRVEELGHRHRQLQLEIAELTQHVTEARREAETYRKLMADQENIRRDLEKTEAQYKQLNQHIRLIQSTQNEIRLKKEELKSLGTEEALKATELGERETRLTEARQHLDAVRKAGDAVEKAEHEAELARSYRELRDRQATVERRIDAIRSAEQSLDAARKERLALLAPNRKTLNAVRKAIGARDEARLLLEASLIRLEITPSANGVLEVTHGEPTGPSPLSDGKPFIVQGAPEVVAEIQGVARIRASGPTGDIETHRRAIRKQEQKIDDFTQPFGTADLVNLEGLVERAESLDRRLEEARKFLEMLQEEKDRDCLMKDQVELGARISNIEKEYPAWQALLPDYKALKVKAGDVKATHAMGLNDAALSWEQAHSAFAAAREQLRSIAEKAATTRIALQKSELQLEDLSRDGESLQDRQRALEKSLIDRDAGKTLLKRVDAELARFPNDCAVALANLEKNLQALQDASLKARDEERKALGTLETLADQGHYSALSQAEEEIAQLEETIRRENLKMEVVKLLFTTVSQCKTEAVMSVLKPVEEAAGRNLMRIAGRGLGRVSVGEGFVPCAVCPELSETPVDPINLSGGEQEQLYMVTRLALAEVLARDERQMAVFDDVLTATDTGRLARVMTLLEEAAEKLQLLILTCHPERYRALSGAAFFDLQQISNQKSKMEQTTNGHE